MLRFLLNEISNSISDYQEFEKREVSRKSQKKTFCKQNENYPLHVSNFRKGLPETEPIKRYTKV